MIGSLRYLNGIRRLQRDPVTIQWCAPDHLPRAFSAATKPMFWNWGSQWLIGVAFKCVRILLAVCFGAPNFTRRSRTMNESPLRHWLSRNCQRPAADDPASACRAL